MCHDEQHGTTRVQDGEDCHTEQRDKKDGTFEEVQKCSPKYREEPKYEEKCNFTVQEWTKVNDLKSSGIGTTYAYPPSGLTATTPESYGAQREGHRYTKLYLDFDEGDACDWKVDTAGSSDETLWKKFADGKKYKVNVRARSEDVVCGDLE